MVSGGTRTHQPERKIEGSVATSSYYKRLLSFRIGIPEFELDCFVVI